MWYTLSSKSYLIWVLEGAYVSIHPCCLYHSTDEYHPYYLYSFDVCLFVQIYYLHYNTVSAPLMQLQLPHSAMQCYEFYVRTNKSETPNQICPLEFGDMCLVAGLFWSASALIWLFPILQAVCDWLQFHLLNQRAWIPLCAKKLSFSSVIILVQQAGWSLLHTWVIDLLAIMLISLW